MGRQQVGKAAGHEVQNCWVCQRGSPLSNPGKLRGSQARRHRCQTSQHWSFAKCQKAAKHGRCLGTTESIRKVCVPPSWDWSNQNSLTEVHSRQVATELAQCEGLRLWDLLGRRLHKSAIHAVLALACAGRCQAKVSELSEHLNAVEAASAGSEHKFCCKLMPGFHRTQRQGDRWHLPPRLRSGFTYSDCNFELVERPIFGSCELGSGMFKPTSWDPHV